MIDPEGQPDAPVLTARSARVKDARALTVGKHRRARAQFLVEGPQAVREALTAGVAEALFVEVGSVSRRSREVEAAATAGVLVHLVDAPGLAGLVDSQTPQGIVAVCRWEPPDWGAVLAGADPAQVVIAHEMADPGNAGALIRVADAAGARGVGLTDRSVEVTNPKCVRASAGSLFHLPVAQVGATLAVVGRLQDAGFRVLAADVTEDSTDLFAAQGAGLLAGRIAWLFGNEAHGLPDEVLSAVDHVIRIPILGRAESLNLATAAAVCLYATAQVHAAH